MSKFRSLLFVSVVLSPSLFAQDVGSPPDASFGELDIEELLSIPVSSASRKDEVLFETAAAVDVLSASQIRQTGALRLPDVLRYATGVQVSQHTSRAWAISIRGFNLDTSNKLEVLMDGRSLYSPLFSGVIWDGPDYILGDLDRIEVIRGPGATMWGANAVNGVINIYTKPAEDTQGVRLETTWGAPETFVQSGRVGFQPSKNFYARVYSKYYTENATWFQGGDKSPYDRTEMARFGFRTDYLPTERGRLVTTGEYFTDKLGLHYDDYQTYEGGHLLARWEQALADDSTLHVQTWYDRYDRLHLGALDEFRETAELSLRHHVGHLERHDMVWGGGYRYSWDETRQVSIPYLQPEDEGFGVANLYLQDEWTIHPAFRLVLGSKYEYNGLVDRAEVQPSARFKWLPDDRYMFWAAISRAVRTPARADTDLRWVTPLFSIEGNDDYKSEKLVAYELGHRFRTNDTFSIELSLFYHDYDDLATVEPLGGSRYVYANGQRGETWGGEAQVEYRPLYWVRLQASYSYLGQDYDLKPGSRAALASSEQLLGNDARHLASFVAHFELPRATELTTHLRYVGDLPAPAVPDYLEMDVRLAWAPRPGIELALIGRNLLDRYHPEYRQASPVRREISRMVAAQAAFTF
ncbi:MAG: TonB-dependent receptor [Verrucomicrobiota bacterium JB022]|nr:TonB-dependent receptor [Verrucomicrobiota bacterium JB022]